MKEEDYLYVLSMVRDLGIYMQVEKPNAEERTEALEDYFRLYDFINEEIKVE